MAKGPEPILDCYQEWLNIPPGPRPPDHYTLLGVPRFESDAVKIKEAARVRLKQVRPRCLKYPKEGTQLLNEITAAQVCLLDPARAAEYQRSLQVKAIPLRQRCFVGIDLGTTFSSLAYVDDQGRVDALRLPDGSFTLASLVYFKSSQEVVIGNEALNFSVLAPERMARAFKRHMADPEFDFQVDGKHFRPEELSAMVLKKLLEAAREQLGPIERAIISVPFVFDAARRQATQEAGNLAGLKEVDLINEPVAASLAFGHKLKQSGGFTNIEEVFLDETVLVYDLAEHYFQATVMRLAYDGTFEVVVTDGDERVGGEDWEKGLFEIIRDRSRKLLEQKLGQNSGNTRKTLLAPCLDDPELPGPSPTDPESCLPMEELRQKTVEALKMLSEEPRVNLTFSQEEKEYSLSVTRADFEKSTEMFLIRTENILEEMLARKGMTWGHIDRIVIMGDYSRMPMVRRMFSRVTGRPLILSLPPDLAIAGGAALYAASRQSKW